MAHLTKATIVPPYLVNPRAPLRLGPLVAGAAIDPGSPCYIKPDGLVYMCITTATGYVATVSAWDGFCIKARAIGDPVTLFGVGSRIHITETTGVLIGTFYWIAATAGQIDTTAAVATDLPFAKGVSATDIIIIRPPL